MSARTVISAGQRSILDFQELLRFRSLLHFLSLRDVFVRYKQTWMGFAWSVIRPLINIGIFGTLSYLIEREGNFKDRFLLVSAGVIFWQLVSSATTEVSNSLSTNSNILTKVYFPKIILPVSSLLVALVDFIIAFFLFFIILVFIKGLPGWHLLLLPVVAAYGLVFAFGLGLLAATASVKYRDVKFILPFLLQILFYVSPIVISSEFVLSQNIPAWVKMLYQVNPLVPMVNAFKYCIFGVFEPVNITAVVLSVVITFVMLLMSMRYFTRFERSFADYI